MGRHDDAERRTNAHVHAHVDVNIRIEIVQRICTVHGHVTKEPDLLVNRDRNWPYVIMPLI